jgi:flagellar P-ring protein precursor FlgI
MQTTMQTMRTKTIGWLLAALSVLSFLMPSVCYANAVRLKDIARINGVRSNQLIGYGIIVGLNGTGDSASASFTYHSIVSMLEHMGITVSKEQISVNNVAAVMVTASLPPFAKEGSALDVTVSSVGNATDLTGGTLLMTPLKGADGNVYAVAQGAISIGGFSSGGSNEGAVSVQKNHPTVGRIPEGATIEREVPTTIVDGGAVTVTLRNPDFTTATRTAEAIDAALKAKLAEALDAGNIRVTVPQGSSARLSAFVAEVENVEVKPDAAAKIVINERTGTIVAGEHVRISKVAVAHGNLSIEIKSVFNVAQPLSFAKAGESYITPDNQATYIEKEKANVVVMDEGVDIGKVSAALNALGVTPRDMITIFQTMREAGALQSELVIM